MPLLASSCTPIEDQTCNVLTQVAQYLLEKTYDALSSCFTGGCEGDVIAYITTGQADDGIMDALTVTLLQIDPSPQTVSVGSSLWRATFLVVLRESGWPIVRVSEGVPTPPPPAEQAQAVQQLLAHGEAIHRRLSYLKSTRALSPLRCSLASMGGLLAIFPQGGVAGWSISVTVDLPWG